MEQFNAGNGRWAGRRSTFRGCVVALLFLSLMMMYAAEGVALQPQASTILKAPYAGAAWSPSNSASSQGCVHALQKAASWSKATGIGGFREMARGAPCHFPLGGVGAMSSASATGGIAVAVPIPIHTSGAHSVVVYWNVSAVVSQSLTPGSCLTGTGSYWSCFQQAGWYIDEYTVRLDLTNSSLSYYASNYWSWYSLVYNSTSCFPSCSSSAGSAAYGHGGAVTLFINATLNKSHRYALESVIGGYADVYFSTSNTVISGGSASADLDLAPSGGQLNLASIVVS